MFISECVITHREAVAGQRMDGECASLVDKCKTEVAFHNCVYLCCVLLYVCSCVCRPNSWWR